MNVDNVGNVVNVCNAGGVLNASILLKPHQHRTPGETEISVSPGNSPRSYHFSNPDPDNLC